jgi:hypothetical protein
MWILLVSYNNEEIEKLDPSFFDILKENLGLLRNVNNYVVEENYLENFLSKLNSFYTNVSTRAS